MRVISVILLLILIESSIDAYSLTSKYLQPISPLSYIVLHDQAGNNQQKSSKTSLIPITSNLYSSSWRFSESFNSTTMKTILDFQDNVVSFLAKIEYSLSSLRLLVVSKVERDLRTSLAVREYVTRKVRSDIEEVKGFQLKIQKPLLSLPAKIQQLSSGGEEWQLLMKGVDRGSESRVIASLREKNTKERAQKLRATKQASLKSEEKIEGVLDLYNTLRVLPKRLEYDYQRRVRKGQTIADILSKEKEVTSLESRPVLPPITTPTAQNRLPLSPFMPSSPPVLQEEVVLEGAEDVIPPQGSAAEGVAREGRVEQFLYYLQHEATSASEAVTQIYNLTSFLLLSLQDSGDDVSAANLFFQRLSTSSPPLLLSTLRNVTLLEEVRRMCDVYKTTSSSLLSSDVPPRHLIVTSLLALLRLIAFVEGVREDVTGMADVVQRWKSGGTSSEVVQVVSEDERRFLAAFLPRYSQMTAMTSETVLSEAWQQHFSCLLEVSTMAKSEEVVEEGDLALPLSERLTRRWQRWCEMQSEEVSENVLIGFNPPTTPSTAEKEVVVVETTAEVQEVAERRYYLMLLSCLDVTFFLAETLIKTLVTLAGAKREVMWERFAQTFDIAPSDDVILALLRWLNPLRRKLWLTSYREQEKSWQLLTYFNRLSSPPSSPPPTSTDTNISMSGRSTKTKNDDKESVKVSIHFLGAKIQFGTSRYADAIVTQSFMRQLTPMNDIVIHGNKYVQSSSRSRYGASNSATSSIGRSTPIDLKEMEEPVQEVVVEEVVAVQPEKKRRGRKRKVVVQELAPIVADEVKENQIHEEEIKEKIEIQPTEEKTEPNDDQYEGVEEEEERQKKRKQLVGSYFRDSTNSLYSAETVETFPVRVESRVNSSPSKAAPVSMEEEEEDDEVMKQVMSLIEDLQAEEAENEAALRNASAFLPPLPRATVRARTPLSVDFERRINAQIESIAMTSSIQGIAFRDKEETLQETNEDEEVEESQTNRRAVGCLTLPKINMTSRFVRYIPNKNMGNHYLDHRLVAQLDVWNMLPESSFDFWLWIDKLRLFQPIAPHTHDPSILHLRDIGLEKYRRRFFTPFELLSLEENGGMSEFSDHSLAPESLFALTVQCRDWLDRSASSEGDDFVEKEEEEAEKELLPDHRPLDVIIDQMEEEIVRWHLQVNRVIARVRRTYFEHHLFWHEASIVSAVQQERKILLNQYRAMQRRKKVVSPSR